MRISLKKDIAIVQAIFAAVLFGVSAPFSKVLLSNIPPLMLSAFLYLGAGIGMLVLYSIRKVLKVESKEAKLSKKEMPYIIVMIILDVAAPISLMFGLMSTTSATASLLNNFEIVVTSVTALVVFKETIGKRLWLSIAFITLSSIVLTVKDFGSFTFSIGAVFVLLACIFWGIENNCTRKLSLKDPLQIVILKGVFSGIGALLIAILANEVMWNPVFIIQSLILGFFAYGMSIFFYVTAQRHLGAARTSAYYAVAPFIGVAISFIIFNEHINVSFIVASIIMIIGTYLAFSEKHGHQHYHMYLEHDHKHSHFDKHHGHKHELVILDEHTHVHKHEQMIHIHEHTPDIHHTHTH